MKGKAEGFPLLRVMTAKSKWGFGKYRDLTIGDIIKYDPAYVAWMYYTVETVSFCQEVMEEMDMTPIDKPGTSAEALKEWKKRRSEKYTWEQRIHGMAKLKAINKTNRVYKMREMVKGNYQSKASAAWYNQGHRD